MDDADVRVGNMMTKQEAIEILKKSVMFMDMFTDESARLQTEAYTLAIKALEKEIDDQVFTAD